ncbi:hypothetical protein VSR68_11330 [Paraburkholderia phymatum]|uniref:hypothetical protein n=1 Tax=Paraburkholderia phymatum TaxID=148447 RepID=UPI003181ED6F
MNRVAFDNELLAACERTYDAIVVNCLKAAAMGIGIGACWYVGVVLRAGAF